MNLQNHPPKPGQGRREKKRRETAHAHINLILLLVLNSKLLLLSHPPPLLLVSQGRPSHPPQLQEEPPCEDAKAGPKFSRDHSVATPTLVEYGQATVLSRLPSAIQQRQNRKRKSGWGSHRLSENCSSQGRKRSQEVLQGPDSAPWLTCSLIHMVYLVMRVYTLRFGTLAQASSHENTPARIHLPSISQANGPPGSPWRRQRTDRGSAGTKGPTMPTLSVLLGLEESFLLECIS